MREETNGKEGAIVGDENDPVREARDPTTIE